MFAALYARVSTTKQAEKDLSIPDQIRQMKDWCNAHGYNVVAEYIEPGASATDDRRPVFQQMIFEACISPAPFDAIIVHSLSRFFRDSIEFGLYERKLNKFNINLLSITQQTTDDPSGDMARKIFTIFDEYQSKENSKHTLRAMKENARQGFFNGSKPPFGYRKFEVPTKGNHGNKKRLEVDPPEAAIVQTIFNLYLNGQSGRFFGIKGLAYYLNEKGITRRGKKWSKSHISDVLQNPIYVGEYYFNKIESKTRQIKPESEWIKVSVDPIIDLETYHQAQNLKTQRSPSIMPPRVVNSPTLLTGILKCGYCGASMTLATGKSGRYRYYKCTSRINQGKAECKSPNIRMETMDSLILKTVSERIFSPERIQIMLTELTSRLCGNLKLTEDQLKKLTQSLKDLDTKINRLYEAVENGYLPIDSTLQERAQEHKARRDEILIEIARLKQKKEMPLSKLSPEKIMAFCTALKERFLDKATNFGKAYLRLLIDEIHYKGQEIVIRGSYHALTKAISRTKPGPFKGVPGFGIGWLPSTDSNRGPSG